MRTIFHPSLSALLLGSVIVTSGPAMAYNLIDENGTELNLDIEILAGYFSSGQNYDLGLTPASSPTWTEAYAKYGFSGSKALDNGSLYGAINASTTGTWGDGDAAGFTTGDERKTDLEELYVGFRNDQFDLSFGRQTITVGDGFILNDDGLSFGKGFEMKELNRGGAYWLAGRKAIDKTLLLRVGDDSGLRSDIFWFESDNYAQAKAEMAGINLEYLTNKGTFGLLHLRGIDVEEGWGYDNRDGQKTTSIRYQGNAGVENLFLSSELVHQSQGNNTQDANAWYTEAGWTFTDLPWSPTVNYRYSSFDDGYDPLFFGFNRGYGTWFQGEVAASYAGPFSSGNDVHYLGVKATPVNMLTVGAYYVKFRDTNGGTGTNDAQEINFWAEWVANDHLIITPLLSFYTPDAQASTQGNDDTNTYFQIVAIVPF